MAAATEASNIVYPVGGIMAAQVAGIPVSTIGLGIILYILGCVARGGFEIQKVAEGGIGMKPSKVAGWIAGGIGASVFATPLYLAALKDIAHMPVDGPLILGLMPAGFYGTSIFTWALNASISFLNKRFNVNIPPFGTPSQGGQP